MMVAPGAAFATETTTISGLESGDSVTVYQVAKYDSTTGQYVWNVTDSSSLPSLQSTNITLTDAQWKYLYDHVTDTGVTSYGPVAAADADDDGTYTAGFTLPKGMYVTKVTNSGNSSRVYQNNVFAVTDATISSENDNVITLKASDIPPKKTVDKSDIAVGETATYTITSTVPTYDDNAVNRTYKIIDILPAGLTFVEDSVTVKAGDTDITSTVNGYSGISKDGQTITVDLSQLVANTEDASGNVTDTKTLTAGQTITVTLKATRNANSAQVLVNQTYVNYSKDSYGSETNNTPPDEVPVYDFSIKLTKVDSNDNSKTLDGAKFTLSTTIDGATKYVQADGSLGDTAYEFETANGGIINFVGLAGGTYTLHETQAPADHVLPTSDMTITITPGTPDTDGKISTWTLSDGTNTTTYNVADSENTASITLQGEVTVKNQPTGGLPTTGEAGTILLTIVGVGLVAVAIGWTARNRKKDNA